MSDQSILTKTPTYSEWCVLQTMVGREEQVADRLRHRFLPEQEVLLPQRRLTIRRRGEYLETVKPLFPGYLFFRGYGDDQQQCLDRHLMLRKIRPELGGMIKILTVGGAVQPLYYHEAKLIEQLIADTETVDYSLLCFVGSDIRVVRGPLVGQEGIIRRLDRRKRRARVELFFMGEPRLVDLGIEMLEVVGD